MNMKPRTWLAAAALAAWTITALYAQDAPPKEAPLKDTGEKVDKEANKDAADTEEIRSYERAFVNEIHALGGRKNAVNPHAGVVWAQRQCRSCHADPFSGEQRVNVNTLLATGTVANALGVEAAPLEAALRSHLNVDEKSGIVLSSVPEGSDGAKAGLKPHDVVLRVSDQSVSEPAKFNELLGGLQGKTAKLDLLRQGKALTVEVAVPNLPQARAVFHPLALDLDRLAWDDRYRIGVTLSDADDTLRSHLKLAAGEGLVVTEVVDGSPAAKMGVKQNDVLTELDGKRLTTVDAINAQIQEIKEKTVLLKLLRSGQEVTCQIAPKKSSEPVQGVWSELVLVDEQARHPAIVRWLTAGNVTQEPAPTAAAELAALKKQLAELGKTVEKLEAVISPPAPPAEEKKPDAQPEKK